MAAMPPAVLSIVSDAVRDCKSANTLCRTMAFVLHFSDFVRWPAKQDLMNNTRDTYGAAMEKVVSLLYCCTTSNCPIHQ